MAKRHLIEYYNTICRDREEAIKEIREFEVECENNLVAPEKVEELKTLMQPLMDNYEQISYLIYLLNKPNKKEKESKYIRSQKNKISKISEKNRIEERLRENQQTIERLRNLK